MSEQLPIFNVSEGNPGFGWVVDIVWHGEPVEGIKGFATEMEATTWIERIHPLDDYEREIYNRS
jgi:hypothetical protein